jgi:hypothetical protein
MRITRPTAGSKPAPGAPRTTLHPGASGPGLVPAILIGLLCSFSPLAAPAQVGDGKTELSPNAALQYWQAFSLLPTLDAAGEKALAESGTIAVTDPAVEKLLGPTRQSLMYLYRAAPLKQ